MSAAAPSGGAAEYRPPWWLPGRHLQTIGGRLFRRHGGIRYHRDRIPTPDGDFLDLDFADLGDIRWHQSADDDPLVLVLHGLEGFSRRGYTSEMYRALARRGIRSVGLNFRSCSGEMNRLPRMYHSGETEDLATVLDLLRNRFPDARLGVVGFSLGGNVLLKYLGERGNGARDFVDAGVAISVPYNLAAGARALEVGMGRFYTFIFLRMLRAKLVAKRQLIQDVIDVDAALRARTFWEFDDAVTAPLHGFKDATDYYHRSSSKRFLAEVRVPTHLIHAEDDPFLPPDEIPRVAAAENPYLTTQITAGGGHVGFITGSGPWSPRFWAEREAARHLHEHLRATREMEPARGVA